MFAKFVIFLINIYQKTISPDKGLLSFWLRGKICKHEPHCSEYTKQALERHGFIKGLFMGMERIVSCTPGNSINYDPSYYNIVFFSSAPIGVNFLSEFKNDKRFEITGVVTQTDKPAGRGMKIKENIIKQKAKEFDIENIQTPESINSSKSQEGKEFKDWLIEQNPDFIVVISYGKIIPKDILDIPNIAPINIHGSLLPKYRGSSPIQYALLNGDAQTGITLMKMNEKLDEGDIIKQIKFNIKFNRTAKDIIDKFNEIGAKFVNNSLWEFGKGRIEATKQNKFSEQISYSEKIEKEDGFINIQKDSLKNIFGKYKAYFLRPKTYFYLLEKKIIIEELIINEDSFENNKEKPLINENWKLNESIEKIILKPEGKKSISWEEFKKGYLK